MEYLWDTPRYIWGREGFWRGGSGRDILDIKGRAASCCGQTLVWQAAIFQVAVPLPLIPEALLIERGSRCSLFLTLGARLWLVRLRMVCDFQGFSLIG